MKLYQPITKRAGVRLTLLLVLLLSCSPSIAQHQYVEFRLVVADQVIMRFAQDMQLSEEQRVQLTRAYDKYAQQTAAVRQRLQTRMVEFIEAMRREIAPDAYSGTPLDDLPIDRQAEVLRIRSLLESRVDPFLGNAEYMFKMNQRAVGNIRDARMEEQTARTEFLLSVETMLSESQLERLPRAKTRMLINMFTFCPADTASDHAAFVDPDFRLDLLGLLAEATRAGAELHKFAAALGMDSPVPETDAGMAEAVVEYEQLYCGQIVQYETQYEQWLERYFEAARDDNKALANGLLRQNRVQQKIMFNGRYGFALNVAKHVADAGAQDDAKRWLLRFAKATCPHVYAEDSVEFVFRHLQREQLSDAVVGQLKASMEEYSASASALREQAMNAEIAHFCAATMSGVKEQKVLDAIQEQRAMLANVQIDAIRIIVGDEATIAAINTWTKEFRELVKSSNDPRP